MAALTALSAVPEPSVPTATVAITPCPPVRSSSPRRGSITVSTRVAQATFITGLVIAGIVVVAMDADGWADWVVFGVIVLTTYGFAVAVSPRIFTPRKRDISRESGPPRPGA